MYGVVVHYLSRTVSGEEDLAHHVESAWAHFCSTNLSLTMNDVIKAVDKHTRDNTI